ncbi:tetratricopeptide repeat protein [Embleya sp. MST-111070]|uniref:serine/threonine-protein kinase n=1 Tax=Embleya sp. MST-111070 TaxID=3398231 RepID=UPI003F73DC81
MTTTRRIIDGRYELLERLGRGGMGEVWTAHDPRLLRTVAVKLLTNTEDARAEELFVREAESVSRFNHPNVVTVYDAGGGNGHEVMYLVMERLQGHDLAHVLRGEPLALERIVDWMSQVCDGLQAAHKIKLIHRDLKPANLFLTVEGRIKILDFGLARTYAALTATASSTIGTPQYMPPERWRGRLGDHRGDLYSLGCVLYELLTGKPPFHYLQGTGHMWAHLEEHVTPPQDIRPEIPAELAQLVLELLAKEPNDRPSDAAAVRNRLASIGDQLRRFDEPLGLARALATAGDFDRAEQLYRRAVSDGVPEAPLELGLFLAQAGRIQEAEHCLRFACAQGDPEAATWIAYFAMQFGRLEEAERFLRIALAGGDPNAAHNLALLLAQQGRDEEAENLYRTALDSGHPLTPNDFANLLVSLGRVEEAEHLYRAAIAEGHPHAPTNLTILLIDLDREEDAVKVWKEALAAGNAHAHRVLAGVMGGLGHDGSDLDAVLAALAVNDPQALRILAEVTARLGVSEEIARLYHADPGTGDPRQ